MQELAVWRPDAFVDPRDYVAHVNRGLRALRRTARDDVKLAMAVDVERPLIELVCVRAARRTVPVLVANLAHAAPERPNEQTVFPAAPPADRLADLGWDRLSLRPVHAWALGPVAAFDTALESMSTRVVDTLREFACPLGFVDLRLQQLGLRAAAGA